MLIVVAVLSLQASLGLVFDPRYRDFPFAPLTGAAIPFALLARWNIRPTVPAAERVMSAALGGSAVYIAVNEGFANWQALWFSAVLFLFAATLLRERGAPG